MAYLVIKLLHQADKEKAFNPRLLQRARKRNSCSSGTKPLMINGRMTSKWASINQKQLGHFTVVTVFHKNQRNIKGSGKNTRSEEMVQWKHEAKKSNRKFNKASWNISLRTDGKSEFWINEVTDKRFTTNSHLHFYYIKTLVANKQWRPNHGITHWETRPWYQWPDTRLATTPCSETLEVVSYCCTLIIYYAF